MTPLTWLVPLLVGVAFGVLLQLAGLTRYERISGVYRLTDLSVLKFLGTAIVVGAILVQGALSLGFVDAVPLPATHLAAQLAGGALFGVGMAVAGFCPGTVVAGAGAGYLDALIPGVAGLFVGALAHAVLEADLPRSLARAQAGAATTLPALLGVSPWLLLALLAELALLGFYALERGGRARPA
jgi:uncharacterized membrane protein YedE/YeeE